MPKPDIMQKAKVTSVSMVATDLFSKSNGNEPLHTQPTPTLEHVSTLEPPSDRDFHTTLCTALVPFTNIAPKSNLN
jgi:hypothetical protein